MNKPWQEIEVDKEKLDQLWNKLQELKENADPENFPILLMISLRYEKFYNDQQERWSEHDAKMLYYSLSRDLEHNHYIELN